MILWMNVHKAETCLVFSDRWNMLDFIILIIYLAIFFLRMISWATSSTVYDNRALAVAGYLYGFIAMFLTLRVFGHVMESIRGMGAKLIALLFHYVGRVCDILAVRGNDSGFFTGNDKDICSRDIVYFKRDISRRSVSTYN